MAKNKNETDKQISREIEKKKPLSYGISFSQTFEK